MKINSEVDSFLREQKIVTLGFSGGKDSLACAILLRNMNVQFIPFFFYHIPDLEFVEKTLTGYEKDLGMNIIRLPHPMLFDYLRFQDFQPPKMIEYLYDFGVPHLGFEDLIGCHLDSVGIQDNLFDVVGQRAAESFNRRKVFEKQGFFNHSKRKVFPICDWKKADVLQFVSDNGFKISDDYDIWGRSFDGLKYQFLFGVKKNYPKDWQTIIEYFPLIELELFRYEQNKKYF